MDKIIDLYLNNLQTRERWQNFLQKHGLSNFSPREIDVIDHTFGLVSDEGKLVGTGSVADNVLKYVAVSNDDVVAGARFNQLVTALQQYLFAQKNFHSFVFTKTQYSQSFSHLGFTELAHNDVAAFLESGTPDINDFVKTIPRIKKQNEKKIASIVMNANPFTLGHRQLIELASQENDLVYLFVVSTDASLFSSNERMSLVKAGTADLKNVIVLSGSDYLVSKSTFPAYFLKSPEDLITTQTEIDALVFKNKIAPDLAISRRYLGTEPFSNTTNVYNQSLIRILRPNIEVKIVDRFTVNGKVITATQVRQLIKQNKIAEIAAYVPTTTMQFINEHYHELQDRIKKGMKIDGN